MKQPIEPNPQALRVREQILKIVLAENDRTGDSRSVFHGLALAFGHVLSAVEPNPKDASAWMSREAQRILLTGEQEGPLQ
ncbi:hypothetical protein [Qipengyuania spongiae]|uniref:Uncharacterized protein n=1 Tax=Qipengyuania spongiae TaxID=2909673 RepID=A0ABY5T1N3_9SPHN|nr:hypothetical protein [Qipengyuania spongiae]UVI39243.1 hypothetical protein L1F33_13585 [Qipengyuania spongiae]